MAARTYCDTYLWLNTWFGIPSLLCLGKAFFQTLTGCRDLLSHSHNWGWWLMSSDKTWLTVAVPVHPEDDEWAWGQGLCAGHASHSILKWILKKRKKRKSFGSQERTRVYTFHIQITSIICWISTFIQGEGAFHLVTCCYESYSSWEQERGE